MKKANFTLVVLTITVTFLMTVFSGCGAAGSSKGADDLEKKFKSLNLPEVTVSFLMSGLEKPDTRMVLDEIENKVKGSLNTRLDFKWLQPGELTEKVMKMQAGGDEADACYFSEGFYFLDNKFTFYNIAKTGGLLDITELFPQNAPGLYAQYAQEELAAGSVSGKLLAIPAHYRGSSRLHALVREDLRKNYELPEIKTYEDYEKYLKTIKDNEKDLVPALFYNSTLSMFAEPFGYAVLDYLWGLVYKMDDPAMKVIAWEQTPEYKEAITYMHRWFNNGYIPKNLALFPYFVQEPYSNLMKSGKYTSCVDTLENVNTILASLKASQPDMQFKTYPLYPDRKVTKYSPMSNALMFFSGAKNADRAIMFLDWLNSSQENYDLFSYGIIDKHYTLSGDQIKLPDGVAADRHPYIGWNGRGAFINDEFERTAVNFVSDYRKQLQDNNTANSVYAPHTGFYSDLGGIIELATLRINSFYSKIDNPIGYDGGIFLLDENDIDKVIQEQKENNVDKLVAEVQRQLDRWKTEK